VNEIIPAYAGADWIKGAWRPAPDMSPLGVAVANLLGDWALGIYHLNTTSLHRVEWNNPYVVIFNYRGGMATFDGDELTRLIVLCHDRCLRCSFHGKGFGYIEMMFHQRQREGSMSERHPTIEAAAARIRAAYHPVLEPTP
jgi:hypothetical protein